MMFFLFILFGLDDVFLILRRPMGMDENHNEMNSTVCFLPSDDFSP